VTDATDRAVIARILVVDDHELAREALLSTLGREADLEIVGEAADGAIGIALGIRLRPDLVLMDVRLPHTDGLAATRALKAALPAVRVLLISTYDTQAFVLEGFRAGADGYLLKGASKQELLAAIRAVLRGERVVQPALATSILQHVAHDQRHTEATAGTLTARQHDVLRLIAAGRSNPEIARELQVSLNTVKTHVVHLLRRLGVSDRTQAAVRAAQLGLLGGATSGSDGGAAR
jgi:DNA-binding NarL/FixJ family response regulator